MDHPPHVEIMKRLGFTEYEARCYLALFERESLSVSEVANLAKVPRPKAYEVLKRLLARGLIVSLPGKKSKYAASDPQLFRQISHETLNESLRGVDDMASKLAVLFETNHLNTDPLDYIKIYRTNHQIHNKYLELISKTKQEILSFVKPPFVYATLKERDEQFRLLIEAGERGVRKKVIYEMPPIEKAREFFAPLLLEEPEGESMDLARVIEELPMKLTVFDNRFCFFTLVDPVKNKTSLTMVALEHEAVARSLGFLFNSYWERAQDYFKVKDKRYYFDLDAYIIDKKKKEKEAEDK